MGGIEVFSNRFSVEIVGVEVVGGTGNYTNAMEGALNILCVCVEYSCPVFCVHTEEPIERKP